MATISIAMATYNGGRFLREQIDSILRQTYLPKELVITDDGSTDDTLNIVDSFLGNSTFPIVVHKNEVRLGYSSNFMYCASLCSGDYISFCDQDDIWRSDKLARIHKLLTDRSLLACFHNAIVFDEHGRRERLYTNLYPSLEIAIGADILLPPLGFTVTFHRRLMSFTHLHTLSAGNRTSSGEDAHDQWIHFLAQALNSIMFLDEDLVKYRQHSSNVFGSSKRNGMTLIYNNFIRSAERQIIIKMVSNRRYNVLLQILKEKRQAWVDYQRVAEAALLYERICSLATKRAEVYTGETIRGRYVKLFRMILMKCNEDQSGMTVKSILKDGMLGLFLGPFLTRRSRH